MGLVLLDRIDRDFVFQILARDEANRFRTFEVETSVASITEARNKLIARMKWLTQQGVKRVDQNAKKKGVNLFVDQIPEKKQHPHYKLLKNHVGQTSRKAAPVGDREVLYRHGWKFHRTISVFEWVRL